jgi:ATP-dependent RNA helicase DeaD
MMNGMDDSFETLGLAEPLLRAISDEGYETPTAIQSRAVPALLAGRDVMGQAQTGTGKTAAFALPMLQRLDLESRALQGLVLTPTRELAIQVAEAIHTYGRHRPGVRVAPIYGGQPMPQQIRRLQTGLHVVVGTPGRLLDHLRRGTLDLSTITTIVLDEADEMLRMGFIEDVETILGALPESHQTALFSATMPPEIVRVAERHLHDPVHFEVEGHAVTVPTIEQRYLNVGERQKLDALTRVLEVEATDAVLVFVRTKTGAAELTERLQHRGWDAEAMHGDMTQAQREAVVRRFRGGQVDIVVATDVAARGWDVERITHVVNYDIPYDAESYVHRIGRTARAGRTGASVLFVTPRETRLLREIERYTGRRIEPMKMPTRADVAARRVEIFKETLTRAVAEGNLEPYLALVEEIVEEGPYDMAEVAAAAARLASGDRPLEAGVDGDGRADAGEDVTPVRLYINAGRQDGIRAADVVGAIANEADLRGADINNIEIHDRFTFLEVPGRYREQVLSRMAGAKIRNRPVSVTVAVPPDEPVENGESDRSRPAPPPAPATLRRRDRRGSRREREGSPAGERGQHAGGPDDRRPPRHDDGRAHRPKGASDVTKPRRGDVGGDDRTRDPKGVGGRDRPRRTARPARPSEPPPWWKGAVRRGPRRGKSR